MAAFDVCSLVSNSRAPTRAPAVQALVASPVAHHDRAAVAAAGSVLLVAERGSVAGVGAVRVLRRGDDGGSGEGGYERGVFLRQRGYVGDGFGDGGRGVFAEDYSGVGLAFAVEELRREPFEDVVHDRFGHGDFGVFGEAARFESRVGEFVDQEVQRDAVLEGERGHGGEAVHEAGDRAAFLGHGDEDLAGGAVLVLADGDVALVAADGELVGD